MEQSAVWSTSRYSSLHLFTYIELTCLWYFNLSFRKKLKTNLFHYSFLLSLYSPRLPETDLSGIDQASLFHLTHVSLSFTLTLFMPIIFYLTYKCLWINSLNLFNFLRHNKSPPLHSVSLVHLISLWSHILVFVILFYFYGANVNVNVYDEVVISKLYVVYSWLIVDSPGKPGTPVIEDVDKDYVSLSWTKPVSDGGDKVSGYVVEVREKGANKWKPLNEKTPCKDTKFTGKRLHDCLVCLRIGAIIVITDLWTLESLKHDFVWSRVLFLYALNVLHLCEYAVNVMFALCKVVKDTCIYIWPWDDSSAIRKKNPKQQQ